MELYTGGRYAELNPDWHEADAPHKAAAVASFLRSLGVAPADVVDVGCGTGEVLRLLADELRRDARWRDATFEGWDVAGAAIERARAKEGPGLRFVHGDLLGARRRADLVLCLDTFEHVGDDLDFLRRLRDHGAMFLLRIPLDLSVLDLLRPGRLIGARRQWGHRHAYTRTLALEVLAEAGYEVVAWRYDRVPPEVSGARGRAVQRVRRALFSLAADATVDWLGGWSLLVCARPAGARAV